MYPAVLRQLRMKCRGKQLALACGHDPAVREGGQDRDLRAGLLDERRPDEDSRNGSGPRVGTRRLSSKLSSCLPNAFLFTVMSMTPIRG